MIETAMQFCPYCGTAIDRTYSFCPHCGKQIAEFLQGVGIWRQLYIYFISLFLPPFGIIYTFKFIKASNKQARIVGLIALILTIISIIATVWIVIDLINQVQTAFSKYSTLGF